jgi:HrpA-like RNA helicase
MYAKVLLASGAMGCSEEALAIVSMVSTDPIFHMPRQVQMAGGSEVQQPSLILLLAHHREKREKADEARKQFISLSGDHLTFLTVFRAYKSVSQKDKVPGMLLAPAFLLLKVLLESVPCKCSS